MIVVVYILFYRTVDKQLFIDQVSSGKLNIHLVMIFIFINFIIGRGLLWQFGLSQRGETNDT